MLRRRKCDLTHFILERRLRLESLEDDCLFCCILHFDMSTARRGQGQTEDNSTPPPPFLLPHFPLYLRIRPPCGSLLVFHFPVWSNAFSALHALFLPNARWSCQVEWKKRFMENQEAIFPLHLGDSEDWAASVEMWSAISFANNEEQI